MTAVFAPPLMHDTQSELFYDQHDRVWESAVTVLNRNTGDRGLVQDRVGYLTPVGFSPPWMLPAEFIETAPRERGQNRIFHNYDRFIADRRVAYDEWEREVRREMQRAFGKEYHTGLAPTPGVLAQVGPAPQAWQPADAARKKNRWILYGEGDMPEKLAPFFPPPVAAVDTTLSWDDEPTGAVAVAESMEDEEDRVAARRANDAERKRKSRARAAQGGAGDFTEEE